MFGVVIRVSLVVGSLSTLIFILTRVRHAKMMIEDTLFWIGFSAILLFISIFPKILYTISAFLGFMAPINFVYLLIIFILIIHQFSLTVRVSQMDVKLRSLAQRIALNQQKIDSDNESDKTNRL